MIRAVASSCGVFADEAVAADEVRGRGARAAGLRPAVSALHWKPMRLHEVLQVLRVSGQRGVCVCLTELCW